MARRSDMYQVHPRPMHLIGDTQWANDRVLLYRNPNRLTNGQNDSHNHRTLSDGHQQHPADFNEAAPAKV